ncbi:MAG: peptidoglycan editing factor PgeF [Cytophagaceae bacterium]
MKESYIDGLKLYQFDILSDKNTISHFVSCRNSYGQDFNLSYKTGIQSEVINNRSLIAKALNIPVIDLIIPDQVHSANVGIVDEAIKEFKETDALITNQTGKCIAVLSADCVPVLLYDSKTKSIGAVHAGWRGTVGRIVEKTIMKMQQQYGSSPEDIYVCIGPSICKKNYEVGGELIEIINQQFTQIDLFLERSGESYYLDLWKLNYLQAINGGIKPYNIEIAGICTFDHNNQFYSARKSGISTGRFAAGIILN